MTSDLLTHLAQMSVPRYTSYPTAADFNDAVGPGEQAAWLRRLDPAQAVSIYLHVPYCRQLCHYCGCHAKAVHRMEPVEDYRKALEAEIALVSSYFSHRLKIGRIAWGGGTPSILGETGLVSVLAALQRHFDFEESYEHSIELDPRTFDREFCRSLARLGINRASLGVQDLNSRVQAAIGRVQPEEQVRAAVKNLHDAGIADLNFDLIYGLPHQTEASLLATCQSVADLQPARIAFYGYAHLPSRRANQRLIDPVHLPKPDVRLGQAATIADFFTGEGYQAIGIDHFARPDDPLAIAAREGRLHRNFQGYTDDNRPNLLGFGCSSISRLPGGFVQSESGIDAYKRRITGGVLPAKRGHAFVEGDNDRARIIERLMCDFRVEIDRSNTRYADEFALLRSFASNGLVDVKDHSISMTETGRPFVRIVAALFDRFRSDGIGQFSTSV
ncbi:oxygen-independent coproporphyrinogen III oxidase [Agrobacterium rosae]|uniref:Coproporphyrinogen-III oxidase n=1 Tax=Agrobacterium rosae TaxID=1972867 RepID=A0AAW9FIF5_9HYPH|nr:oxygen-independent coproporphyrinogen III oxidase [Agrobacterium rosae]MDX8305645.1 oxygen-independent coproporphyrinogen III oxidase [Agrobacterium rosae]MDX8332927.1 oxygen-independent coproporphyrinogen III oxidase [Agrobacterium rosae]